MTGRVDAATRLERALLKHADAAGIDLAITAMRSTRWASATFVGARHRVEATLSGPAVRDWLATLPEADLPIPEHLVADVVMVEQHDGPDGSRVVVEVLTVEDGA